MKENGANMVLRKSLAYLALATALGTAQTAHAAYWAWNGSSTSPSRTNAPLDEMPHPALSATNTIGDPGDPALTVSGPVIEVKRFLNVTV